MQNYLITMLHPIMSYHYIKLQFVKIHHKDPKHHQIKLKI